MKETMIEWEALCQKESLTLEEINIWVNHNISYVNDATLYDKEDYWASPLETLKREAGDCEDIAILKYFTMLKAGFDMQKTWLGYVFLLQRGCKIPHVVLYSKSNVYDNLINIVLPLSSRKDLVPVFFFNDDGLYINEKKVADVDKLPLWKELLNRSKREK
jgi:predicted transglutaminase-like cysteine proteinase